MSTSLFCYIEDLPESAFDSAIPWAWETWPEYQAHAAQQGFSVNCRRLRRPHPASTFRDGSAGVGAAGDRDRAARDGAVLDQSLAAGALGLSTSLGFDEDRDKRPVPSRLADDAELTTLLDVVAAHTRAVQFIPDQTGGRAMRADVERMAGLCGPRRLAHTWIGIFHDENHPDAALRMLDHAHGLQQQGINTLPQISPRTLDIRVNWQGGMSWFTLAEGWHRAVQANPEDKRRLLSDPQWRAVAREEWDRVPRTMIPHKYPDRLRFVEVRRTELAGWVGRSLADLVADRGGIPQTCWLTGCSRTIWTRGS